MCDYFETFVLACAIHSNFDEQLDDTAILSIVFQYTGDLAGSIYLVERDFIIQHDGTVIYVPTESMVIRAFSEVDAIYRLSDRNGIPYLNIDYHSPIEISPRTDLNLWEYCRSRDCYCNTYERECCCERAFKGTDGDMVQYISTILNVTSVKLIRGRKCVRDAKMIYTVMNYPMSAIDLRYGYNKEKKYW